MIKKKNGMYTLIIFITSVINIALTIILIPIYGLIGAAIGTAVSVILGNTIAYYWCLQKETNINIKLLFKYTFKGFIKTTIVSSLFAGILNLIFSNNIYLYILKLIMFSIVYGISIYIWVLNENEKSVIKNKINLKKD